MFTSDQKLYKVCSKELILVTIKSFINTPGTALKHLYMLNLPFSTLVTVYL